MKSEWRFLSIRCDLSVETTSDNKFLSITFCTDKLTSIRIRKHVGVFYVINVQCGDVFRFLSIGPGSIGLQSLRGRLISRSSFELERKCVLDENAVRDCSRCWTSSGDGLGSDHPRRCSCFIPERHEYEPNKKRDRWLCSSDRNFLS